MFLDDDKPDYFLADNTPEEENEQPGRPTISFEEPEKPRHKHSRWKRVLVWMGVLCVVVLGVAFWLRYENPYATDCRVSGYVTNVEKRGLVFKTYEADVVSEQALTDTTRVYSHNLSFSVENPEMVRRLQAMQGTGKPVQIVYRKYYGTLPWRGASKYVIEQVKQ